MARENEIIRELNIRIKELIHFMDMEISIKAEPLLENNLQPDLLMHISYENLEFDLVGEVVSQQSSSVLKSKIAAVKLYASHSSSMAPIIVAEYLSPERRELCQREGVFFLDLSGNVFIKYKSLYLERVGFPNMFPEKRKGRGIFSDKASLILREVFKDVKKQWGVRELARAIGIDPGFVSRMGKELEKRDYFIRVNSKLVMQDPKSILEDWVYEYDYKKNKEMNFFCLSKRPEEILEKIKNKNIPDNIQYALGFQAGANLISPYSVYNEVHIYIDDISCIKWFADNLNLSEVEEGANLKFLLPHYRNSVFYDIQKKDNLKIVSDIQLYLDLCKYPIRGREQADHLYEKRLKNIFEG